MSFIKCPLLPESRAEAVLISASAGDEAIKSIGKMGIKAIVVPPCKDIAPPVASHPDMLFHHLGSNVILCCKAADIDVCRRLKELGFNLVYCESSLRPEYPYDIALNAARVGNFLFCNIKFTDKIILAYCNKHNIHIVPINQGYTKCSVCVADENSIITADNGIAKAAEKVGIDVLLIESGHIELPGYNTGFFGGCCGKIAQNQMLFFGNIKEHPDYVKIKGFLAERSIALETLGRGKLFDIGSIIPLTQI